MKIGDEIYVHGYIDEIRKHTIIIRNDGGYFGTGAMVLDWMEYELDGKAVPKIHPTQKPVKVLKRLIEICTDPGDVVIDPCFGSGSTARACIETRRSFFGFEINKEFCRRAQDEMCNVSSRQMDIYEYLGANG